MSEVVKSQRSENAKPSETDKLMVSFLTMGCGMMLVIIVGVLFLGAIVAVDAPRQDRIRSLQEATCTTNGMKLLQDKYHPAVCAFRVDEEGKRIPD